MNIKEFSQSVLANLVAIGIVVGIISIMTFLKVRSSVNDHIKSIRDINSVVFAVTASQECVDKGLIGDFHKRIQGGGLIFPTADKDVWEVKDDNGNKLCNLYIVNNVVTIK